MRTKTYLIQDVEDSFREYGEAKAALAKEISDFFKEKNMGVTVIVDEIEVELQFTSHKMEFEEMHNNAVDFQETIKDICRIYGLKIVKMFSFWEQRMALPEEARAFRHEKVILIPRGVENEQ